MSSIKINTPPPMPAINATGGPGAGNAGLVIPSDPVETGTTVGGLDLDTWLPVFMSSPVPVLPSLELILQAWTALLLVDIMFPPLASVIILHC